MTTTTTTPAQWTGAPDIAVSHCRASHSLDDIMGYVVVRTVTRDGEHVNADASWHEGATSYAQALTVARTLRGAGGWAVVDSCYACGCRCR